MAVWGLQTDGGIFGGHPAYRDEKHYADVKASADSKKIKNTKARILDEKISKESGCFHTGRLFIVSEWYDRIRGRVESGDNGGSGGDSSPGDWGPLFSVSVKGNDFHTLWRLYTEFHSRAIPSFLLFFTAIFSPESRRALAFPSLYWYTRPDIK